MGGMGPGFHFPVQLSGAHFPGILVSTAYRWSVASPGCGSQAQACGMRRPVGIRPSLLSRSGFISEERNITALHLVKKNIIIIICFNFPCSERFFRLCLWPNYQMLFGCQFKDPGDWTRLGSLQGRGFLSRVRNEVDHSCVPTVQGAHRPQLHCGTGPKVGSFGHLSVLLSLGGGAFCSLQFKSSNVY